MRRQIHAHKSHEGMSASPDPRNLLTCFWECVHSWVLPKSNSGQDKALYRIVQADSLICDCMRMNVHCSLF